MRQANEHGQSLLTKEEEELIYWKAQTTLAFDWTIFPAYSSSSAHYQKAMLLTAGFRESVFSVLKFVTPSLFILLHVRSLRSLIALPLTHTH